MPSPPADQTDYPGSWQGSHSKPQNPGGQQGCKQDVVDVANAIDNDGCAFQNCATQSISALRADTILIDKASLETPFCFFERSHRRLGPQCRDCPLDIWHLLCQCQ